MFDRHSRKAATTSAIPQNNMDPVHVNALFLLIHGYTDPNLRGVSLYSEICLEDHIRQTLAPVHRIVLVIH